MSTMTPTAVNTIVVEQEHGHFKAYLEERRNLTGTGRTEDEALSDLILNHKKYFNILVKHKK